MSRIINIITSRRLNVKLSDLSTPTSSSQHCSELQRFLRITRKANSPFLECATGLHCVLTENAGRAIPTTVFSLLANFMKSVDPALLENVSCHRGSTNFVEEMVRTLRRGDKSLQLFDICCGSAENSFDRERSRFYNLLSSKQICAQCSPRKATSSAKNRLLQSTMWDSTSLECHTLEVLRKCWFTSKFWTTPTYSCAFCSVNSLQDVAINSTASVRQDG